MRRLVLGAAAMVVFAVGAFGQEVTQEAKDASITARVESKLVLDPNVGSFEIDTSTRDGVVTLTGGVDDDEQKRVAGEIAGSVPGVVRVDNNIVVVPDAVSEKDRRSFREKLRDKGISTAIRGRMVGKGEFKGLKVGIDTVHGEVTLSGVVRSDVEKQKIVRIAQETAGVEKVYDNLSIVPPGSAERPIKQVGYTLGDETIEKRVEKAILVNKHLNSREIDVEVNDGVVILTGNVDTEEQRKLAEDISRSLAGVTEVRNDIRLYDNVTIFYPDNPATPVQGPAGGAAPAQGNVQLQDIDPYEEPQVSVEAQPLATP